MSQQQYIFNEPGSIPGIPGTFANCRVEIDAAGAISVVPLDQHPAFAASAEPIAEAEEVQDVTPPAPESVQEPPAPILFPNNGG